jgi:hypothetical protein
MFELLQSENPVHWNVPLVQQAWVFPPQGTHVPFEHVVVASWQTLPAQHACPLAPQPPPDWHVPLEQLKPVLHAPPAQQACPLAPQPPPAWHFPPVQLNPALQADPQQAWPFAPQGPGPWPWPQPMSPRHRTPPSHTHRIALRDITEASPCRAPAWARAPRDASSKKVVASFVAARAKTAIIRRGCSLKTPEGSRISQREPRVVASIQPWLV